MQTYGDTIPPYPMLIVRPDGVGTYSDARAALNEWDDQFGYELVPAEVELAYPAPDPQMKERIAYAVKKASDRVAQLSVTRSVVSGSQRYNFNPGGAGGSSRSGQRYGGSGRQPSANRQQRVPRLSVSQMDRQGRKSGFRDHRAFPSYNSSSTRSSGSPSYYGSGTTMTAEEAKRRLDRQFRESAGSIPDTGDGNGFDRDAQTAIDQIAQTSPPLDANRSSAFSQTATEMGEEPMLLMPANGSEDETNLGGISDVGTSRKGKDQVTNRSQDNPYAFGPKSGASGMPQQDAVQPPAGANAQPSAGSMSQAPPSQPQSNAQPAPQTPQVNPSGADWALPGSVSGARGLEIIRPIGVELYPDRFVLRSGSSRGLTQTFSFGPEGMNSATLKLATAIRDRIDQWGAAAPGARWSPRLKVSVSSGAEPRFAAFEHLMTGRGLPIDRSDLIQAQATQQGDRR